jgi:hypothetical protein
MHLEEEHKGFSLDNGKNLVFIIELIDYICCEEGSYAKLNPDG